MALTANSGALPCFQLTQTSALGSTRTRTGCAHLAVLRAIRATCRVPGPGTSIRCERRPSPSSSRRAASTLAKSLQKKSRRSWRRASAGEEGEGSSERAQSPVTSSSSVATAPPSESTPAAESSHAAATEHSVSTSQDKQEKETKDVQALKSLDAYFNKLKPKEPEKPPIPVAAAAPAAQAAQASTDSLPKDQTAAAPAAQQSNEGGKDKAGEQEKEVAEDEIVAMLKKLLEQPPQDGSTDSNFQVTSFGVSLKSPYQQWLDAQLIANPPSVVNILLALNIAVFLFELASPEAVPGLIVTSLPSLLGAKVNALISGGEWWRLVTPMFLYSGFFHAAIGCAALLSIGPGIELVLGPLGFLGAYVTGGVFGNLMSFLQTPEVTVGGTGPLYGIVGAFVVYLYKNKEAIGKDEAENTMWSFIFFAALNVALGNPLPIDDWTHIGAAVGGLLYGALAAPKLTRVNVDFTKESSPSGAAASGASTESSPQSPSASPSSTPSSSATPSSSSPSSSPFSPLPGRTQLDAGGSLFLLEHLSAQQQALVFVGCLGVAALLLGLSSSVIPEDLMILSDHFETVHPIAESLTEA